MENIATKLIGLSVGISLLSGAVLLLEGTKGEVVTTLIIATIFSLALIFKNKNTEVTALIILVAPVILLFLGIPYLADGVASIGESVQTELEGFR